MPKRRHSLRGSKVRTRARCLFCKPTHCGHWRSPSPRLPDFQGADRRFGTYRTRISNEMRTGPNFAWHYAIVEIGCGTSCRFVFIGDVATGRVYEFPYGGEEFYMLRCIDQPHIWLRSGHHEAKTADSLTPVRSCSSFGAVQFCSHRHQTASGPERFKIRAVFTTASGGLNNPGEAAWKR